MDCDIAIIGGGPAAMAAAIYTGRANLRTRIIERAMVGGQSAMTHDIANYPGFPDGIAGQELADRMQKQAEQYGVEFVGGDVKEVGRLDGGGFSVRMAPGDLTARVLIVATGSDPSKLGVPGEEALRGRGVSYCGTCDGPFFRNKEVIVVGGGDSALKEGLHIARFASKLTIIHRRDAFRAEKIYQQQVFDHEKIDVRWNATVKEIRGEKTVDTALLVDTQTGEEEEFATQGVFIFVGSEPNTHFLCPLIEADCGGHIETDTDMMSAVPGVYAVGDVRKHSYRQIATAVGEGATAAIAAEHYLSDLESGRRAHEAEGVQ